MISPCEAQALIRGDLILSLGYTRCSESVFLLQ